MTWQEPLVVLIVGWAFVSLVRHIRGMVRVAAPGKEAPSCHGCDNCEDDKPS